MQRLARSIGSFLLLTLVGCSSIGAPFSEQDPTLTLWQQDRETEAGIAHLFLSQPLLAWDHFQRVADANPHYSRSSGVGIWTLLGLSNYEMGRLERAHGDFDRALVKNENDRLAQLLRAALLIRQGQTMRGNKDSEAALRAVKAELAGGDFFGRKTALKNQVDTILAANNSPVVLAPQLEAFGGDYLRTVDYVNPAAVRQCAVMDKHADILLRWQDGLGREIEKQRQLQARVEQPRADPQAKDPTAAAAAPQRTVKKDANKEELPVQNRKPDESLAILKEQRPTASSPVSQFKNVEARDTNQDGKPDLWVYYDPLRPGNVLRQEEDTNGDGNVDTWSYFKDGKLVRREADKNGDGKADTVYYYQDGRIAREERDEEGDGRPTFRALYQEGRLAKVEKDTDRDGKMDLWIYYDPSNDEQVILKEEKDVDGDGVADIVSYYENGRLTRRDVSEAGLSHSANKEISQPQTSEIHLTRQQDVP